MRPREQPSWKHLYNGFAPRMKKLPSLCPGLLLLSIAVYYVVVHTELVPQQPDNRPWLAFLGPLSPCTLILATATWDKRVMSLLSAGQDRWQTKLHCSSIDILQRS